MWTWFLCLVCELPHLFSGPLHNHGVEFFFHYLDDFLTLRLPDSSVCRKNLSNCLQLCFDFRFGVAHPDKLLCSPGPLFWTSRSLLMWQDPLVMVPSFKAIGYLACRPPRRFPFLLLTRNCYQWLLLHICGFPCGSLNKLSFSATMKHGCS